jgi:hypothetical protein
MLQQQTAQVEVLQQQLATQAEQLDALNQANANLSALQDQMAALQAQQAAVTSGQQQNVHNLDWGIAALQNANNQLAVGSLDGVDLSQIVLVMPGQAAAFVATAEQWIEAGDLYTARGYLQTAYDIAVQAREQGTAIVPQQGSALAPQQ